MTRVCRISLLGSGAMGAFLTVELVGDLVSILSDFRVIVGGSKGERDGVSNSQLAVSFSFYS